MIGSTLRQVVRGAGFGLLTLGAGTGVLVQVTLAEGTLHRSRARDFWASSWSKALLRLFHVDMVVHGDPGDMGIGRGKGRVVAANHRSIIDIAVMLSQFGGSVLSRGEVARWPIIGYGARSAGTIFVDRSSKQSGAQAIAAMVERLSLDDTICIFPEGTTFVDDEVRPFRLGAFVAASRARTPVLPVGIAYPLDSGAAYGGESFVTHLARLAATPTSRVFVEIGSPVTPGDDEPVEAFAGRCRDAVAALVARAREREAARG